MVRRKLRVGDVVEVQDNVRDYLYHHNCGIYIHQTYIDLIGRCFRIKKIENFVKRGSAYHLGNIITERPNRPDTKSSIFLSGKFLKIVERPCVSLKKKGKKIEDEIIVKRRFR